MGNLTNESIEIHSTQSILARLTKCTGPLSILALVLTSFIAPAQENTPPRTDEHRMQSDTAISYIYGPWYKAPFVEDAKGNGANIAKNIVEFTHADHQSWGGNMFDIYLRHSSGIEAATGGGSGATEAYIVERSEISLARIPYLRLKRNGIIRDIALSGGVNLSTKNSQYAPEERTIFLGPAVQWNIPQGMLEVAIQYRKEWNHEGILGKSEEYDSDVNGEAVWLIPIHAKGRTLNWKGFAEVNSPKGMSTLGIPTRTETLIRTQATTDPGRLFSRHSSAIQIGCGMEFWRNFAGMPGTVPGSSEMTPFVVVSVHLPGKHE